MLRPGLHFGRARGEDRFYIPVKARKNQNQNQKQRKQRQQKQQEHAVQGEDNHKNYGSSLSTSQKSKTVGPDNRKIASEASLSSLVSGSEAPVISQSNLQRFLESTTPLVPAQYLSKTTMRGWRTCNVEFQPYFTLDDLWTSFEEWSAYGAGVPLVLDGSDYVMQYYVPYLSGIQLYVESLQSDAKSRLGEESDGDYYRDSSSDGSDYEIEGVKFSRGKCRYQNLRNEIPSRMNGLSISDSIMQEGFSSNNTEAGSFQHPLVFEFLDQGSPYCREPLADKISDLARHYPKLKTLRSCDLLPISWVSVAWYPIYRIPTGPTLKDLDACFLTYHSLSAPTEGNGSRHAPFVVYPNEVDGIPKISLSVFGMASYKFKGSMWARNGANESEHQLANSLMKAAENRLRLLQVNHPDFQFFASHGMYDR
ncbi:hypothetical protein SLEP1_g33299 [Rubroshorea leprosula]|uniref:Uncharacterized protein n=1 Tax=Rubroshorea leprosula TaxID=152421 RepID=A0AAV5KG84_9ROSI|nr:hypothetical protein SLEP1_g33299 [Rubroshorea leprosula]